MTGKYHFTWELLGDLSAGRPNLGPTTRVEMYRLMQYCFRDVLEEELGTDGADRMFYRAGFLAGSHFYDRLVAPVDSLDTLVAKLQARLREMGVGVLRVEHVDLAAGQVQLTVAEDLDCSGLPETDYEMCRFDEGFLAAVLQRFTGKRFDVKEIDCWCTGDRTCRFRATAG